MSDTPTPTRTVTLPEGDWQTLLAALYELPMKFSAPVAARLQAALAEPNPPERSISRLREAKNE